MPVYEFEGRRPSIDPSAFIAPSATVIGDVRIGADCYVGHGAILRGDYGTIELGAGTAVEEGVIIHARPGDRTRIGERVTLGHGAMLHNTTIGAQAVIGMRATVVDFSVVGEGAIVGEGALVRNHQKISPWTVAVGVPAVEKGAVSDEHRQLWAMAKELYIGLCSRNKESLKEIDIP